MKYGLVIFDGRIEDYFDMAGQLWVSHLEMDLFAREQRLDLLTPNRIRKIKELAREAGISMSLHLPYCLNPAALIPEISQAGMDYFKRAFGLAAALGVRWVTAHPGYYQGLASWEWMRREAMSCLAGFLREILAICEETGIAIALENNAGSPENGQFFSLGSSVDDFRLLFEQLGSPYLRMCLDTGHANTAEGVLPYLDAFPDKILNIHIHDNNGIIDDHLPPGQGTIDWRAVCDRLARSSFKGVLSIELLRDDDKRHAVEYLKQMSRNRDTERMVAL